MREWLKHNPWVWIVLFFLVIFVVDMALVVISILNRPVVLPH